MTRKNKTTFIENDALVYKQEHLLVRARWRIVVLAVLFTVGTLLALPVLSELTLPEKEKDEPEKSPLDQFTINAAPVPTEEIARNEKSVSASATAPSETQANKRTSDASVDHTSEPISSDLRAAMEMSEAPSIEPDLTVPSGPNKALRKPEAMVEHTLEKRFPLAQKEKSAAAKEGNAEPDMRGTDSSKGFPEAEVDKQPMPISQSRPRYPFAAKQRGIEGRVTLEFVVTEDGHTRNVSVIDSESDKGSSQSFEKAAEQAVRNWRFQPGTKDGQKVPVKTQVTIEFRLK